MNSSSTERLAQQRYHSQQSDITRNLLVAALSSRIFENKRLPAQKDKTSLVSIIKKPIPNAEWNEELIAEATALWAEDHTYLLDFCGKPRDFWSTQSNG